MKPPRDGNLSLKRRALDAGLKIGRAEVEESVDDPVAAEVSGLAYWRTPTAVGADERVLVAELRIGVDETTDRIDVVAPDRVYRLAGLDEEKPARAR